MYQWWVFVHLAGVFGFLLFHGVSVWTTFRLRKERDPSKVNAMLEMSGASTRGFYISLVVLLLGGIVAGFIGHWWSQGWIWASLLVLVVTSILMLAIARPFYRRVGLVARAIEGGSQAVTAEQFDGILRSRRPISIMAIGFIGLGLILYFMLFKPTFGFGGVSAAAGPATTQCVPSGTSIQVTAKGNRFDAGCLAAPAGKAFTIAFDNQDPVQHNVAIYTNASLARLLFRGDLITGPRTITYRVGSLPAGKYYFRCDVHTFMNGTFVVG
jgi:plastocyanin